VAALPVAAYGLMLLGDLASGVTPRELFVIGPIVMACRWSWEAGE